MGARRLRSEARREQIACAAAALFARKGFDGVTTREIARKAGVSEAMLYRHFPTKEALYTEIIRQKVRVRPDAVGTEALARGDDEEVLKAVARSFFRQMEEDPTILRLMLHSALGDHELASVFLKGRETAMLDFLLEYIVRRQGEGAFRKMDPAAAVRAFIGMFFHYIMVSELFDVPRRFQVPKGRAIDEFVRIFLRGVRA